MNKIDVIILKILFAIIILSAFIFNLYFFVEIVKFEIKNFTTERIPIIIICIVFVYLCDLLHRINMKKIKKK